MVDLSLMKSASPPTVNANVSTMVTFTVMLHNGGPADATGVKVTDQIMTPFIFDSSMASPGTYDSGTGVWSVGTLQSGNDGTLTITTHATCTPPGTNASNSAAVTAVDQTDTNNTNDSDMATVMFSCD
jgi:uncharacterized repeat protein (TIGR01451 family)